MFAAYDKDHSIIGVGRTADEAQKDADATRQTMREMYGVSAVDNSPLETAEMTPALANAVEIGRGNIDFHVLPSGAIDLLCR